MKNVSEQGDQSAVSERVQSMSDHGLKLCQFTGLPDQELARLLRTIPDDNLSGCSADHVARAWPLFLDATRQRDAAALDAPELRRLLLTAFVANYCRAHDLLPSQLADSVQFLAPAVAATGHSLPSANELIQGIADYLV